MTFSFSFFSQEKTRKNDNIKNKKIIHCFTGNKIEAKKFLENDFYFGITGWICDEKRNTDLIEALKIIPIEKLLIETDAPYLTPHPHRGERNEPFYTTFVSSKMAELLEISDDEIQKITTNNAKKLFKEFSNLC